MQKKVLISSGVVLIAVLVIASWGYWYTLAQENVANRLAVIEDKDGNRIGVEPLSDEGWSKLVDLFHTGEKMWIGGSIEEFINIQPDKYYRWGFRFKSESICAVEVTAEGLQATIEYISENLDYWLSIGQAFVFAKVVEYYPRDNRQVGGIEGTVTDHDGTPLAGMRIGMVNGTTFFPEIATETNGEGYYHIGGVPQGTFEVAVHDRQGNRIGLENVTVRDGETSTLKFIIQSTPLDVTKFTAVVNGMMSLDVFICVNIIDGLTKKEAELIVGTSFIWVKGEYFAHRLDTLTFDDAKIEARYTWGVDENDMGHVFDVTADLTKLQLTITHCR
ncbi:MAG: carboxypeptidase-like regulatory domain-containing protein [Candidatus Bathyarchaeota archaeon]|nr:carboxypeptidase-like regulatory domain-containing protein [Candidatus Bathyarchaeota archaeon]